MPTLDDLAAAAPMAAMKPDADTYQIGDAIRRGLESIDRVPVHYREAAIEHPEVQRWCGLLLGIAARRTVPNILRGPSLMLLGKVGTGKTHQGYAALRFLALSGAYCSWQATTCADMYGRLRPGARGDSEAALRKFADARVLFLDDLGAAKASEWTEEVIYRVINHRYERELPTLITTNVRPAELTPALGERVASRLSEMTHRAVLEGPDRRRPQKGAA